jgi:hypothetical protein
MLGPNQTSYAFIEGLHCMRAAALIWPRLAKPLLLSYLLCVYPSLVPIARFLYRGWRKERTHDLYTLPGLYGRRSLPRSHGNRGRDVDQGLAVLELRERVGSRHGTKPHALRWAAPRHPRERFRERG